MHKEKVILCAYHWTGCEALRLLLKSGYEVFVFTHEPSTEVSDLIEYCKSQNVSYSTEKITKENLPFIPEFIASIYYRYIISNDVISLVGNKIFNLHPSLLPKYRGCSSLTWAIINGETETGYTYHYIDKGCDTGSIVLQKIIEIYEFDTQQTLFQRVMFNAMKDFNQVVDLVKSGYVGEKQVGDSSYYKRGAPYNGEINEDWDIAKIKRFIRAMKNPPYPYAKLSGKEVFSYDCLKK